MFNLIHFDEESLSGTGVLTMKPSDPCVADSGAGAPRGVKSLGSFVRDWQLGFSSSEYKQSLGDSAARGSTIYVHNIPLVYDPTTQNAEVDLILNS